MVFTQRLCIVYEKDNFRNELMMKPFLKWPGGKQWLVNKYLFLFPSKYNKYFEPFLGGGAVFFALQPQGGILSDINEELINLYLSMRDHPAELAELLVYHNNNHSKSYYYSVRKDISFDPLIRAARTLYLNRTCFNGIYRVNLDGSFNVPIGSKSNCIYDIDKFNEYSSVLKKCDILQGDFADSIRIASIDDFIFVDPPYISSTKDEGFIKYNDKLFSWDDQIRLYQELVLAKQRGVKIALTNKDNLELERLYQDSGFFVSHLFRESNIKAKKLSSTTVAELFITSYEFDKEQYDKACINK